MIRKHMVKGKELYLDPKDGRVKLVKVELVERIGNRGNLYLAKGLEDNVMYLADRSRFHEKRRLAIKAVETDKIIDLVKSRCSFKTEEDLLESIEYIVKDSGEQGFAVRYLIKKYRESKEAEN